MRYHIQYHMTLNFEAPVTEQQCELRLLPREEPYQKLLSSSIELRPEVPLFGYTDAFGNSVRFFSVVPAHESLEIHFQAEVENCLDNPFDFSSLSPPEEREAVKDLLRRCPRYWDFVLENGETVPSLQKTSPGLHWPVYDPQKNLLDSIQNAMEWIFSEFRYEPGTTDIHCPLETVVEKRSGVCQDFAHLLIALVRHWEFPARYVMGYQHLKSGEEENAPPATHAWTEIFIPGVGWRGFDATHRVLANNTYLPVAVGRDSRDAAPQRGVYKGKAAGKKPEIDLILKQQ